MGRNPAKRFLTGIIGGAIYSLLFEILIPTLFYLVIYTIKGIRGFLNLLPQRIWIGLVSLISSYGFLLLYNKNATNEAFRIGMISTLTFGFCYLVNYAINLIFSGNTTPSIPAEQFYRSKRWQTARFKFLRKTEKKCVLCGSLRGPFHVDHIKPRSKYPKLALDINNFQLLCEPCNLGKGADDSADNDFRRKRA